MKLKDVDVIEEKDVSIGEDAEGSASGSAKPGLWPVERVRPLLEAVLFAAADPLSIARLCEILDGPTGREVYEALKSLRHSLLDHGIRLVEVAGGWQLRTAPEHQAVVRRLFKERPQRLTRAAVETLAIVAYRQPCTRQEVEGVRGVDSGAVLESLVERNLLRIMGRRDAPGRPLVYSTTKDFLELFGLKDLKALPTLAELGDDLRELAAAGGFEETGGEGEVLPLDESEGAEQAAGDAKREGHAKTTSEGETEPETVPGRRESGSSADPATGRR